MSLCLRPSCSFLMQYKSQLSIFLVSQRYILVMFLHIFYCFGQMRKNIFSSFITNWLGFHVRVYLIRFSMSLVECFSISRKTLLGITVCTFTYMRKNGYKCALRRNAHICFWSVELNLPFLIRNSARVLSYANVFSSVFVWIY